MPTPHRILRIFAAVAILIVIPGATLASPQVWNIPICTAAGDQSSPLPIPDGAGGGILVWLDGRDGGSDLYAHHVRGVGQLDPAWPPEGLAVHRDAGTCSNVSIAPDGAGGAFVTWQDDRLGVPRAYAHHVRASGTLDPTWPPEGLTLCTVGDQRAPSIAFDGLSGAVIAWEDRRGGAESHIFAQHVGSSGTSDWTPGGVEISPDTLSSFEPGVVPDDLGGTIVVFKNTSPSNPLSAGLAMHLLPTGDPDPAWPPDGQRLISGGPWAQGMITMSDGSGGALIGESRETGVLANAVWAEHVLPSGAVSEQWIGGTGAHRGMGGFSIAPDGLGGVVGAWIETYYVDVPPQPMEWRYDLHVTPTPYPTVPGPTYNGIQAQSPVVAGDGEGGTIVAWIDRSVGSVLRAGHVLPTGIADPNCPAGGKWISGAAAAPKLLSIGAGGALLVWQVQAGVTGWDIFGSWLPGPTPTPVLVSLVNAEATPERVRLEWSCGSPGGAVTVYRAQEGTAWSALGELSSDAAGVVRYEDRAVEPGRRYGYRLGVDFGGAETMAGETWVRVPELALALAPVRPSPMREGAEVRFTVPGRGPVSLDLFDAGGRGVRQLARGEFGPGEHVVRLARHGGAGPSLAPGLYFLRLDAGGRRTTTRVVILP